MSIDGWIKLHRKFAEWEWFSTPNMVHLFIHILLTANHKDGRWKGIDVKKGQLVTGLYSLNEKTGISTRSLRTCLSRLEKSGEIVRKTTSKYTIITIRKYCEYQELKTASDKQATNKRQTSDNKQEEEEEKEVKRGQEKSAHGQLENVLLSEKEFEKLKAKFNGTLENRIDRLSVYLESSGKKYKSHYATILKWAMSEEPVKKESEWQ